jgi:hypothetical protein
MSRTSPHYECTISPDGYWEVKYLDARGEYIDSVGHGKCDEPTFAQRHIAAQQAIARSIERHRMERLAKRSGTTTYTVPA